MTTYNFKKDTKLHVVRNGLRYTLDIYPDISFSQTFNETNVPVKTLHSQYNMFENAVITKANPANFTFTIPMLLEGDMGIVLELLTDYDTTSDEATLKTSDLYVESNSEVYKLEKAVFESGTFQIVKNALISLSIAGTARKLRKYTDGLPGVPQARTATRTFSATTAMMVAIAGTVQDRITAVSIELKNDVQWMEFATLHNSMGISDVSGTMFPETFFVSSRTLSGTIQQYVTDETNSNVNSWNTNTSINVQVGNLGSDWTLQFLIPTAVFTNRVEVQDLLIQSYDFRMTSNVDLSTVIKKRSI